MNTTNRNFRAVWPLALAMLVLASACDLRNASGPGGDNANPPEIPPASTVVIDFDEFASAGASSRATADELRSQQIQARDNWGWAATHVLVWNAIISVNLVIPVAAFVESFDHDPVRRSDGTWVWSYSFRVLDILHTAELHGKIVDDKVQWQMFISKENFFSDFLWFSGESDLDATAGSWTFFKAPADPVPMLDITWRRNPADKTADIKYTNVIPGDRENGGYIHYGVTTDPVYDAFYDIFNKGRENHTNIEWQRATLAGRVKDPNHFGESEWHCWDETLTDIQCQ